MLAQERDFESSGGVGSAKRPRLRHWRRWLLVSVVLLIAVVVAAIGGYVALSAAPPLALPERPPARRSVRSKARGVSLRAPKPDSGSADGAGHEW